jgi:hypothetical protein
VHRGSRANRRYQWFRGGRGRGNFPFYPPYDPYAMYPPMQQYGYYFQSPAPVLTAAPVPLALEAPPPAASDSTPPENSNTSA